MPSQIYPKVCLPSDSDSSQIAKINHYEVQGSLDEDEDKDITESLVNFNIKLLQTNILGLGVYKIPQE